MSEIPTLQRPPGHGEVSESAPKRRRASSVVIRGFQLLLLVVGIVFTVVPIPGLGGGGHLDQAHIPAFLIALAISWWLTPEIRARAVRLKLVDPVGDPRKVHKVAVPRLGGVAIYIAVVGTLCLVMALCGRWPREGGLAGIAAGGTLIFVLGLLDDLESIPAKVKLLVQVLAACAAYSLGVRIDEYVGIPLPGVIVDFGPIQIHEHLRVGALAMPLTVMWLVGISNAVNLIDGMDGLAAGVSAISAVTIWSIAMAPGEGMLAHLHQPYPALIAAVLAGALVGFLRWNFNPARIFLGDSGAYLVGFTLASVAVTAVIKKITLLSIALPMLILFFPLLDTTWAIIRRTARGKSIFAPDAEHIHHRLLNTLGQSHKKVAYVIYGFSATMGFFACSIVGQQWYYLSVGISILAMALFFAEVLNRNRQRKGEPAGPAPDEPPDLVPGESPAQL